jgi:hypothetical protein
MISLQSLAKFILQKFIKMYEPNLGNGKRAHSDALIVMMFNLHFFNRNTFDVKCHFLPWEIQTGRNNTLTFLSYK